MAGNIFTAIVFIAIAGFFLFLFRGIRNARHRAFSSAIEKGLMRPATEAQVRDLQSVFRRNRFAKDFAIDRIHSVGITDDGIHVFDSDLGGFKAFVHAKSHQVLDLLYACKPEPYAKALPVVSISTKPYFRGTPASWPEHFRLSNADVNLGLLRGSMTDELSEVARYIAACMKESRDIKHVMWGDGWVIVGTTPPQADQASDGTADYERLIERTRRMEVTHAPTA